MENDISEKNDFVIGLRDYLASIMNTEHYYTYGDSDYEAVAESSLDENGY